MSTGVLCYVVLQPFLCCKITPTLATKRLHCQRRRLHCRGILLFQSVVSGAHFDRKHLDQGHSQLGFVLDLLASNAFGTNYPGPLPHVVSAKYVAGKSVPVDVFLASTRVYVGILDGDATDNGVVLTSEKTRSLEFAVIVVRQRIGVVVDLVKGFAVGIVGGEVVVRNRDKLAIHEYLSERVF